MLQNGKETIERVIATQVVVNKKRAMMQRKMILL